MVYHSRESQVYLFGGADEKEVLSDLWTLHKGQWKEVPAKNRPGPRTFASMTYDKQNNRIVLFGGSRVLFGLEPSSENLLGDTWQFKDGNWLNITTKNSPVPRAEAAMVYDKHRQKIVLFGGYTIQNGEYVKLGDTWEFYDNNWHLISRTGPSKRHGTAMAYDNESEFVVLFGGSTADKQYGQSKGETWIWQEEKWHKLKIEQPEGIFNASMIYDANQKQLIRFGGWNGNSRINETWSYKNTEWKQLRTKTSPTPRNHSNMVYDEARKKAVLFGGHDGKNVLGDLWEFDNNEWTNILDAEPIKRVENGH
ncbi:MAG: kelch repeat-containing protein [Saonia sp.]